MGDTIVFEGVNLVNNGFRISMYNETKDKRFGVWVSQEEFFKKLVYKTSTKGGK